MHASSFLILAAGAMSAAAQSTTTSTSTMTATITITQCNPTNTKCPLYKPTSTSSSIISTSTSSVPAYSVKAFPAHNTTTVAVYPTANYNTTAPKVTSTPAAPGIAAIPSKPAGNGTYPATPIVPASGAASLQSGGLVMGVMGAVAALLL